MTHDNHHYSHRAAVLGTNDGIVSTASLIIGAASARTSVDETILADVAGVVAGAMPMAAEELVSVSSQSDTEKRMLRLSNPILTRISISNRKSSRIFISKEDFSPNWLHKLPVN